MKKRAPKARGAKASAGKKPVSRASGPKARMQLIDPGWAWDDGLPLVEGKRIGPFIYTSGQGAIEPDGKVVGVGDIKAQTRKALENIATVLKAAGADLSDVIKITSYLTNIDDFQEMLKARAEAFGGDPPASTAIVVKSLAFPEMLIEIEAIAIKL